MKNVLEYGKRVLISVVAALVILAIVIVLIEWKNLVDPVFTCSICKEDFWWFPHKATFLGQELELCGTCARTLREAGEQIGSLFG